MWWGRRRSEGRLVERCYVRLGIGAGIGFGLGIELGSGWREGLETGAGWKWGVGTGVGAEFRCGGRCCGGCGGNGVGADGGEGIEQVAAEEDGLLGIAVGGEDALFFLRLHGVEGGVG